MNISLESYIRRSSEILTFDKNKKGNYKKYNNEYKNMISFLEFTLNEVKKNYNSFSKNNTSNASNIDANIDFNNTAANRVIKYNEETNQYYCNIDGIELYGNIGNIYDRNILKNDRIKAHQVVACKNGNECHNILKQKYCKFYHDPRDLLLLKNAGVIGEEFYKTTIQYTRNFANTSWIYSPFLRNKSIPVYRPVCMRSFGSKSTLEHDIKMLELQKTKEEEVNNFKAQVMHDLIVLKNLIDN